MAIFRPGYLQIERHALNRHDHSYNLSIYYKLHVDARGNKGMLFNMRGVVHEKSIDEEFFLLREQAFDFAHYVFKIAQKKGLRNVAIFIGLMRRQYDLMFENVGHQLDQK